MDKVRWSAPLLLLCCAACSEPLPPEFGAVEALEVPVAGSGAGARLTSGANDRLLLSWMEQREDGANLVVSEFSNGQWQVPQQVSSDQRMFVNWADLPSVTALDGDYWVAHWLSENEAQWYAYDIRVAHSLDAGRHWSEAITVHSDGTASEHGFATVFVLDGSTGMLWLDGRKTVNTVTDNPFDSGTSLRAASMAHDGTVLSELALDQLVCDCCQTAVAIASDGPVAVYRDRSPDEIRDIYVTRYSNGEWQPAAAVANDGWRISGCPVNGPAIAANGDTVGVAWFTAAGARPLVKASFSHDGGRTFGQPIAISNAVASGQVDIVFTGRTGFVVSWLGGIAGDNTINLRSVTSGGRMGKASIVANTQVAQNLPQMESLDGALILAWMDRVGDELQIVSVIAKPVATD